MIQYRKPTISVIINVFNGSQFIREAVDSILAQNFVEWELIIVDDGSSDDTSKIISEYLDPRIISIRNERNLGIPASVNAGLNISRGDLIARLDADDVAFPSRLAFQYEYMAARPDVVLLGCAMVPFRGEIDANAAILPMKTGENVGYQLLRGNIFKSSATMFRRAVIENFGIRFNTDFPNAQDYEFWSRLALVGRVDNVDHIVGGYRLHDQQQSHINTLRQRRLGLKVQRTLLQQASRHSKFGLWNRGLGRLWALRQSAALGVRFIQAKFDMTDY